MTYRCDLQGMIPSTNDKNTAYRRIETAMLLPVRPGPLTECQLDVFRQALRLLAMKGDSGRGRWAVILF